LDKSQLSTLFSSIEIAQASQTINPWSVKTAKNGFENLNSATEYQSQGFSLFLFSGIIIFFILNFLFCIRN
jgi:hypothetical protein